MDLYIIRHAQSTNNALPAAVELRDRVCDPLLTELGYRQAEHVAEHLATGRDGWSEAASADPEAGGSPSVAAYGITRLVCSPMRRTLLTAQPASQTLGLQPEIWLDIHEHGGIYLDHGEPAGKVGYPGITRPEVHAQFPSYHAPEGLTESGWWRDGFEEWETCLLRAGGVARRLRAMNTDDAGIAMVTHGAFASALIMALVGTPPDARVHFSHHNTGISLVHFRPDGGIRLRYLNRVPHLPPGMIT
jgi:2,3-bisphosphoglycerate-dependent phosphoglycerate mutase